MSALLPIVELLLKPIFEIALGLFSDLFVKRRLFKVLYIFGKRKKSEESWLIWRLGHRNSIAFEQKFTNKEWQAHENISNLSGCYRQNKQSKDFPNTWNFKFYNCLHFLKTPCTKICRNLRVFHNLWYVSQWSRDYEPKVLSSHQITNGLLT